MTTITSKVTRAQRRLGAFIDEATCEKVAWRDLEACETAVKFLSDLWDNAPDGSCCKPYALLPDTEDRPFMPACEHLRALWDAREYATLARIGAPQDVFPCHCDGTGIFHTPGRQGPCFGCGGKGYQTARDRQRNRYYWNHVANVWS